MKVAPEMISGQRRPKTFASWPNMGINEVLVE